VAVVGTRADGEQHQTQTEGWVESLEAIDRACRDGQFDGVLGFSQGTAGKKLRIVTLGFGTS
jgi:hypothetical protein